MKPLQAIFQFLCWLVTGHKPSETDHGYGGGQWADTWCRWCDKRMKIPLDDSEMWGKFPDFGDTVRELNKKGSRDE